MTWLSDIDDAAKSVTCNLLKNDGVNAALWGTIGAAVAAPEPASTVAGAVAGLGLIALQNGCEFDPNSGSPSNPYQKGCGEVEPPGYGFLWVTYSDGNSVRISGTRFTSLRVSTPYMSGGSLSIDFFRTKWPDNEPDNAFNLLHRKGSTYELRLEPGSTCKKQSTSMVPNPPGQVVTGTTTNCNFNVEFQSWYSGPEGVVQPVYKISSENQLRTEGDIVGGCSFNPVIYVGDSGGGRIGGGPPAVGPWNPDWDDGLPGGLSPIQDFVNDLLGGVAGNIIYDKFKELTETPWAGVEYRIDPSCPPSGSDPELPVVIEVPALKGQDAIITRLDALIPLLQAQKDLKQPICRDKPILEGEWRTISFRSEQTSPFGKSRLRKRFRYRSLSGFGLEQLVDYWAGFSFEAGPVCVIHKGASWGTPQVWAATADEGKRVIRHAAGEASIDPDQVGQWIISGSDSSRVGVSDTMNVDTTGGYYWITCRDGSSERPVVAKT